MKNRHEFEISYFKCPFCGLQMTVPRKTGRFRKKGHIKDLYCVKCGKKVKMRENDFKTLYEKELLK